MWISRSGSATGNGAGWPTRDALSGGISHTSTVASMNSSRLIVLTDGRPRLARCLASIARSNRPFEAMITRSVRSRSTGLPGRWKLPHAQLPAAPRCFTHTTSPRSSRRRSSCRMVVTSAASDRYGRRPRLATLTAMRPPGWSTRTHSANTSREHLQVLDVVGGDVPLAQRLLVRLAGEVRRRGDHQRHRVVGHVAHVAGVADDDRSTTPGSAIVSSSLTSGAWKRS